MVENRQESAAYLEELSQAAPTELRQQWEDEIQVAEAARVINPAAMDVMAARIPKAPTLAKKRLELLSTDERGITGEIAWIMAGFKLEEQKSVYIPC